MLKQATRIAIIYVIFGGLWITLSDRAVALLFPQAGHNLTAQTIKGISFVVISALLIFSLISRALTRQHRLQRRLDSAENELRQMVENSSDLFFTYRFIPDRCFTYVSPSCLKITGYSQQEHYANPELGFKLVHPDDRHILSALSEKIPHNPVLLRWIRKDGKTISVEHSIVGIYDDSGKLTAVAGLGRDVTEANNAKHDLELLNHAYTVLWQINRLIVKEKDIERIFIEACQIPLSSGRFTLAWVGHVDKENNRVTVAAAAGAQAQLEYLQDIRITLDDTANGQGPTGMAARFGRPFWKSNIASDSRMAPWRDKALAHGFHSSASFPLSIAGKVVAVWTLYSPVPDYFSARVQRLYDQLAGDISFALQTIQTAKERDQLLAKIKQDETKYASLIEQLPVVVYTFCRSAEGKLALEMISEAVYSIFPITREAMQATGMGFFQFIHPDDKEIFFDAFGKSVAEVSEFDWRGRILSEGQTRYVRLHSIPRRYDNGDIRWHGIAEDETRIHEMQNEILISTQRWETALTATGDGLWDWNFETNEIFFSPTLSAMLGYSPEEWGTDLTAWENRVHPDDIERANQALQAHFDGQTPIYSCEHRLLCKDGSYLWVLDRGKVVERNSAGKPKRMVGLHSDISESKRLHAEALEREESFSTLFTESPLGISVVDTETSEIIAVNPRFCEILGRSAAELRSMSWPDFTHRDDIAENRRLLLEMKAGRRKGFNMRKRYLKPDGTMVWSHLTVAQLSHYHEARAVHIALIDDVTEIVEHEERLDTIITEAPLGIAIIDSESAELLTVNPKYCEITGRSAEELQGLTWKQITHADDIAADEQHMDELNIGKCNNFKMRKLLLHRDGAVVWISMTVARLTHYHEARRVHICLIEDITEVVRNEERMRLDSAVISNTRDGVVITDLEPRIISVNRAYTEITGYSEYEVLGQNPSVIKSGRQDAHFYRNMWNEIKATGRWQGELYNRRKNGEIYPQISSIDTIYDTAGNPQYYVGVFSDMAKLKKTEESFERLAHYDVLTGLPNRLMVTNRLNHAIETAKRRVHSIAVLFMDLDHFKNVNDSLGHVAGDDLLSQVAGRLRRRLRSEDTMARLGGDEFLIVLEDIEAPSGAAIVARDIIATFSIPFRLTTGHDVYSACSIGISVFPQDGETSTDLIRNADAALYLSKSEGRNTFRFYTNDLTAAAKRRLDLESQLRRALDNNELTVYYQPIVEINSGEVVGAEALCRWFPAGQAAISPAEFIPVAEETGLIVPLGDFVLQTACRDAALFHRHNAKFRTMAVNASVRQFQGAEWFEHIRTVLEKNSLAAGLLEIEVTESTIMNKGSEAIAILERLREVGIRIAIDDFGTGYSSLSYLQRFAVNQLKIDQSFVREMTKNEASLQLVRTMIAMAKSLGLSTLAEGIETTEHLEILRTEGCTYYQGYLKSAAVPADKFMKDFL